MSIWFHRPTSEELNKRGHNTMVEHVGIHITEVGEDFLTGTMPVDQRTNQPLGLLHGGASCVLAETLGSIAANVCIDQSKFFAVGLSINASHIKSARSGLVKGTARPFHLGKNTQVWDIRIENEAGRLVCVSRLTMAVVPLKVPRSFL